jgi:VanZ family protein
MLRRQSTLMLWLAYVTFVVYGSLVPLEFVARPVDEAWAAFTQMPFLRLGLESRADWVANGILYVPVGFLTAILFSADANGATRWLAYLLALIFGGGLALGLEFIQLYFPPRTVSLNDLLAEGIGTALGVLLAARLGGWFRSLLESLGVILDRRTTRWLLQAYVAAYLGFVLFPFDFLISWSEIEDKANSPLWGWWIAGDGENGAMFIIHLAVEAALTVPVGWALAAHHRKADISQKMAGIAGLIFGAAVEITQFFIATGISQGISVATRMLGVMLGAAGWQYVPKLPAYLRRSPTSLKWVGAFYIALLLTAAGWFSGHWASDGNISKHLDEVHFLPFYYHYFTSEGKALYSLGSVFIMYMPIGLLVWMNGGRPSASAGLAIAIAAVIETSKLFMAGTHPDPTNLLIAAVASGTFTTLMDWLTGQSNNSKQAVAPTNRPHHMAPANARTSTPLAAPVTPDKPIARSGSANAGPTLWALAGLAWLLVAWKLTGFPTAPEWLGLGIVIAAIAVWQRPAWIFIVVPAALPVLDLAPWSGRFFMDEFDLLLLALIPVAYLRTASRRHRFDGALLFTIALLGLSFALSTVKAIGFPTWPDANAFTNYFSPYNAIRITKGFIWAVLLLGLVRRLNSKGDDVRPALAWGMSLGLGLTVGIVLWERLAFSGLFNFDSDYRVTALFSAIHIGGAYIEAFLSAAVPFLVVLLVSRHNLLFRLAGIGLLGAATYALMVTYSRNGYSAYLAALGVILYFALAAGRQPGRRWLLPAALSAVVFAAGIPVFLGNFAQTRMSQIGHDIGIRTSHWTDTLTMRDDNISTWLFGMGIGRFPETAYWKSRTLSRSGTYRLESEGNNLFLRMTPGSLLNFEQFISLQPNTGYILKFDSRAQHANTEITVPICQKWMLAPYKCIGNKATVTNTPGVWTHHEISFDTRELGNDPWYVWRPIKLSLYNSNANDAVDVDNFQLEALGGENILLNGNFTAQLDHWFFSTDIHLPWHAHSMPVAILFDQGWFGVIAWSLFLGLGLHRLVRTSLRGDLHSAAIASSVTAILIVGIFDTVIDAPRFLLLLVLLVGIGAEKTGQAKNDSLHS